MDEETKMGLMPIIFTALSIFVAAAVVILLVSYILYKLRPEKKPYIEIPAEKIRVEAPKPYYAVPVYETPVRKPVQKPVAKQKIRYNDINRFEVLNQQKPRYMQSNEARTFTTIRESIPQKSIYEYYSNGYNESGFRTAGL